MPEIDKIALAEMTSELIAAYVTRNHVQTTELPGLIASVHETLGRLGEPETPPAQLTKLVPPVSIKKSITNDHLVSLEDGKPYKSLKRHLARHGLTPAEYREKWGLPHDYPMVAPAYAAKRSELAKGLGLGRKRQESAADEA